MRGGDDALLRLRGCSRITIPPWGQSHVDLAESEIVLHWCASNITATIQIALVAIVCGEIRDRLALAHRTRSNLTMSASASLLHGESNLVSERSCDGGVGVACSGDPLDVDLVESMNITCGTKQ